MSSQADNKQRIVSSADLLRRGASLLGEACPRCGGVQVKFKGNVYCLNEDDLSELLSTGTSSNNQTGTPISNTAGPGPKPQIVTKVEVKRSSTPNRCEVFLKRSSKNCQSNWMNPTTSRSKQRLLELISKYVDTLNKL